MRILVAEDCELYRLQIEKILSKLGYEVVMAEDGQEAWRILQEQNSPRLAILDWLMPGMEGIEICRKLRDDPESPYRYVLLLTARDSKKDIVEGLESGADDYLTKPFHLEELKARLRVGERIIRLQDKLHELATHDPLTALWNRRAVLDILKREMERAGRHQSYVGVFIADLDHFKQINDTYGHQAGDAVLAEAARRMQEAIRKYDSLGRYGGEEFLAVMPDSGSENTFKQAERIRKALAETPIRFQETDIRVTMSIGFVSSQSDREAGAEELIRFADGALYRAKSNGRNRVEAAIAMEQT